MRGILRVVMQSACAMEVLVLCCAVCSSSALMLGTPSPQRALPRMRARPLVAAEGGDDLLDAFRKSATSEEAVAPSAPSRGLIDELDDEAIEEPTVQELVAGMPGYEKVVIGVAAGLFFVFIITLIVL